MKNKFYFFLNVMCLMLLINFSAISQGLIISEVADGTGAGGFPKICEITNTSTLPIVMDGLKLKMYANGGSTAGTVYTITSYTLPAGQSLVMTNIDNATSGQLWSDFSLTAPANVLYSVSAVNSNGDDVYELTDASDVVIDVYGLVGQDGTGQGWEFLDSYAYRNSDIVNGNQTFTLSEWTYAGPDFLDPYAADLSPYLTIGIHVFTAPTAPVISNIAYTPSNPTNIDQVDVDADVTPQGSASIVTVTLNWGTVSGSLTNQINMTNVSGTLYTTDTQIPAQVNGTTVFFTVEATDNTPETTVSPEDSYFIGNQSPVITNIITIPVDPTEIDTVSVSADVTDDGSITLVTLFWGTDGATFPNNINMTLATGSTYVTDDEIPAHAIGTDVYFYIEAIDDEPDTTESADINYTVIQAPGNYIFLNGDFEDWTMGIPDEWDLIDDSILVAQESTIIHGGTYSAKFDVITGDQTDTDFRQWVSVIAGQSYDLSVWVYHTDSLVKARIYCGSGSGAFLTYSDNIIINQWQEVIATYVATATEDIEVGLRFYDQTGFISPSVVYVDDYTFDFTNRIFSNEITEIQLFPNPANDYIIIRNPGNSKKIVISNIYGQVVDSFDMYESELNYDLSKIKSGMYLVSIENSDGTSSVIKFIRQ